MSTRRSRPPEIRPATGKRRCSRQPRRLAPFRCPCRPGSGRTGRCRGAGEIVGAGFPTVDRHASGWPIRTYRLPEEAVEVNGEPAAGRATRQPAGKPWWLIFELLIGDGSSRPPKASPTTFFRRGHQSASSRRPDSARAGADTVWLRRLDHPHGLVAAAAQLAPWDGPVPAAPRLLQ